MNTLLELFKSIFQSYENQPDAPKVTLEPVEVKVNPTTTATIENGIVTKVTVTTPGSGYVEPQPDWYTLCEALTKASESCRLEAYPDPGTNGAPYTIGWGYTGPEIHPGTTWTQNQANSSLKIKLISFGQEVDNLVKVELTPAQKAALVDFTYNEGATNLAKSTLLFMLNKGAYDAAADQFAVWNLAAGKVLPGLVLRRAREQSLFKTGKWK